LSSKNIVVFDFDGTLAAGDLNYDFGKYAMRHSVRPWLFLPLTIFGFLIRPFNKSGMFWRELCRMWACKKLVSRMRAPFLREHGSRVFGWAGEQIAAEKKRGYSVALISASPDFLLREFVKNAGWRFDIFLCSKMDAARPWKYKFLCYGENKLTALNKAVKNCRIVRAYSDSRSDMPIMRLAREQVWINPKTGMRRKSSEL
jgi:phosphoserine phosphatase